jgi:hypothetical protein
MTALREIRTRATMGPLDESIERYDLRRGKGWRWLAGAAGSMLVASRRFYGGNGKAERFLPRRARKARFGGVLRQNDGFLFVEPAKKREATARGNYFVGLAF